MLAFYWQADGQAGIADALCSPAISAMVHGANPEQRPFAEAACHADLTGDDRVGGRVPGRLAAVSGDERQSLLEQAAAHLARAVNFRGLAEAYSNAAHVAFIEGAGAEALSLLDVALKAVDKTGGAFWTIMILGSVGLARLFSGDLQRASDAFERQLRLSAENGFRSGEGRAGLAAVAAGQGHRETAKRLRGAARVIRYPTATFDEQTDGRLERDHLSPARAQFGTEAWRPGEAAGAEMSYEQAITYALAERSAEASPTSRTFMFTDIVKSTDLLSAIGDEAWVSLLAWHDRALRNFFVAYNGEEISHTGDGFFVVFPSAPTAIECAVEIQRMLYRQRREQGFAPAVRIGVHGGIAARTPNGYAGRAVHEAARIAEIARGGEIVVSDSTLIQTAIKLRDGMARRVELKGLDEPFEVVTIDWRRERPHNAD
jgi:class 3 adenylate cyclase